MGAPAPHARLVVSLLAGKEEPRRAALKRLASELGPVVFYSEPMPFTRSAYYDKEMGPGLTRRLAAFGGLRPPGELAAVKRLCVGLEGELAREGRRRVNLDPGLLGKDALILATRKFSGHRLELTPGVYGEVTLFFHGGGYHPLPWTYPDYAGEEMRGVLDLIRGRLLWSLKRKRAQGE
jgi:hypothetical protein